MGFGIKDILRIEIAPALGCTEPAAVAYGAAVATATLPEGPIEAVEVWVGTKEKLEILSMHVLKAAKRIFGIPDFRYYALADGIKSIFQRIGKGPMRPEKKIIADSMQLSLLGPWFFVWGVNSNST